MVKDRANITISIRSKVMFLPSNGTIANTIDHDFDLHYQGHEFWNANISKMVRASEKCSSMTYRDWYLHNGTIANVVFCDLDLNIEGHKSVMLRSRKSWELCNNASYDVCRRWYLLLNYTIVNVVLRDIDLHFQGQTISYYAFAIKMCAGSGCSRQICLNWLGPAIKLLLSRTHSSSLWKIG